MNSSSGLHLNINMAKCRRHSRFVLRCRRGSSWPSSEVARQTGRWVAKAVRADLTCRLHPRGVGSTTCTAQHSSVSQQILPSPATVYDKDFFNLLTISKYAKILIYKTADIKVPWTLEGDDLLHLYITTFEFHTHLLILIMYNKYKIVPRRLCFPALQ